MTKNVSVTLYIVCMYNSVLDQHCVRVTLYVYTSCAGLALCECDIVCVYLISVLD